MALVQNRIQNFILSPTVRFIRCIKKTILCKKPAVIGFTAKVILNKAIIKLCGNQQTNKYYYIAIYTI